VAEVSGDRAAFAERLRLQIAARYRGTVVDIDAARYSLRVHGPGLDVTLPLAALHAACERQPARTAALIADFVASAEASMVPRAAETVSLARVLWCVRSRRYLASLARSEELLVEEIAADMAAFIAESLPGQVMRGVPRAEWESAAIDATAVRRAADENTAAHFTRVVERIGAVERIPADGWRLAGESLYQGSIVKVPAVLRAFVDRCGGDVLIGIPDRAVALVMPAALPAAEGFGRRVVQEWRDAMNPCSREVLRTDGTTLAVVEHGRKPTSLLPWLND
jgi:uncharacterized protein YtpQ (UPF0354 family)